MSDAIDLITLPKLAPMDEYKLMSWLRVMPGGQFLPADVLDREPERIGVYPDEDCETTFWCLFRSVYAPIDTRDDELDIYEVPKIVADCLRWYEDEASWTTEEVA